MVDHSVKTIRLEKVLLVTKVAGTPDCHLDMRRDVPLEAM
jgi:hypothetical protein